MYKIITFESIKYVFWEWRENDYTFQFFFYL